MTYSVKQAEQTVPQNETKNPPDAKPADWRSPWKGAAIGGTLGGLITTALGYLYGHRGRWLAYDAIAGGGTGAAVGYGVDAHNNAKSAQRQKSSLSPYSVTGRTIQNEQNKAEKRQRWEQKKAEKAEIDAQGGLGTFWDNVSKFGLWKALVNKNKANEFKTMEVDKPAYEDTNAYKQEDPKYIPFKQWIKG